MNTRILIVDDEPEIANGLEVLLSLENKSYHVVGKAMDGLSGYEKALELRPDIIITDIRMPLCNGLDMIRDLKNYSSFYSDFIIISGYAEFEYAKRAMEYGVRDFLTKPIDEEELFSCIRRMIKEQQTQKRGEYPEMLSDDLIVQLENNFENMDEIQLQKTIHQIFIRFRDSEPEINPEKLRMMCVNLVLFATRKLPFEKIKMKELMEVNALSSHSSFQSENVLEVLEEKVLKILSTINQNALEEESASSGDVISQAKAYIKSQLLGCLSLTDVADHFSMNPFYFSQLFKKKTGETFQKYITDLRMKKAKELLENTDKKIYEICEDVGYLDTNYFSRLFEKNVGMKPSIYRDTIHNHKNSHML